ncbi:pentapeptide repeat-containing protein [Rubellicoccus peritrichatus]|uniref:Pentapeptide repeat-containing protein n=1 Tax=Rubellicoccus peritrichatus TaxID=3080537 RepID=A0AAQ3LC23_9BACT|nr:pentapeptide repeat-containing protein [Puniceicoccus sp. CR14]WOO41662.1 pentapeptide repeat-containing protein [Puniceicoccus sp. CR14]
MLKEEPTDEKKHIREWAIEVVNRYSGVSMSKETKDQLLGSRLVRQDLSSSDFRESNLQLSNFQGALFDGSSFKDASMRGVDLRGVDLGDALTDEKTKLPEK